MIKAISRFLLLLVLSGLLVFAPDILSAVSAPYSLPASQRILLRVALCCDGKADKNLQTAINTYQKANPSVHLRITQTPEQQLVSLSPPYPDAVVCPQALAAQLPEGFVPSVPLVFAPGNSALLCAASSAAGAKFAAYIEEAFAPADPQSEI